MKTKLKSRLLDLIHLPCWILTLCVQAVLVLLSQPDDSEWEEMNDE